jgi:hypothetical protein
LIGLTIERINNEPERTRCSAIHAQAMWPMLGRRRRWRVLRMRNVWRWRLSLRRNQGAKRMGITRARMGLWLPRQKWYT